MIDMAQLIPTSTARAKARQAILKDEPEIAKIIQEIVTAKDQKAVLNLDGTDARTFVALVQDVSC
jgi:hypothetical protein